MNNAIEQIVEARPRRFRRYPEYKDSGVEWLGEIPKDWEVTKIKSLARPGYKTFVDGDWIESPYITRDGIRLIQTGNIGSGEYREKGFRYISEETFKDFGCTEVEPDDILICRLGEPVARACLAPRLGKRMITSVDVCILKLHEEASAQFLVYSMSSCRYLDWVGSLVRGSTRDRVSRSMLGSFVVPFPPPAEQRAIAAFLDRETARIDGLVARKERLIELLQEKRTALITRAVTRGLDPTAPMKDSGLEWLGEIPAHWEVKRLRHIMRHIEQGWSPDCENREAGADEWGVLKAGCVNRGTFLESEHKALPSTLSPIPALEIRKGDLLMSRASGSRDLVGSVAVVSECRPHLLLCDKVFRLHTESSAGHRQFIGYAMNSRIVRWQIESAISGGSGLASNISQEAVKDLVVVQPPRSERWEIAGYLDCETTRIDALISKIRQAIDHLKEFRTALISAAVTGKNDVRKEAS